MRNINESIRSGIAHILDRAGIIEKIDPAIELQTRHLAHIGWTVSGIYGDYAHVISPDGEKFRISRTSEESLTQTSLGPVSDEVDRDF